MTTPGSPVPPPPSSPVPAAGPPGQVHEPWVVVVLWIVTFGIYGLFWQYRVFEDLKLRTGQGIGGLIGLLLAFCIGIVNVFLLPSEVGNMYAQEGLEKPVTGLTGFWVLIPLVGFIIWIVKIQGALNRRWEATGGTHV